MRQFVFAAMASLMLFLSVAVNTGRSLSANGTPAHAKTPVPRPTATINPFCKTVADHMDLLWGDLNLAAKTAAEAQTLGSKLHYSIANFHAAHRTHDFATQSLAASNSASQRFTDLVKDIAVTPPSVFTGVQLTALTNFLQAFPTALSGIRKQARTADLYSHVAFPKELSTAASLVLPAYGLFTSEFAKKASAYVPFTAVNGLNTYLSTKADPAITALEDPNNAAGDMGSYLDTVNGSYALFALSCSRLEPTPTPSPVPTATPSPTPTPTPTPSPTPSATPSPTSAPR